MGTKSGLTWSHLVDELLRTDRKELTLLFVRVDTLFLQELQRVCLGGWYPRHPECEMKASSFSGKFQTPGRGRGSRVPGPSGHPGPLPPLSWVQVHHPFLLLHLAITFHCNLQRESYPTAFLFVCFLPKRSPSEQSLATPLLPLQILGTRGASEAEPHGGNARSASAVETLAANIEITRWGESGFLRRSRGSREPAPRGEEAGGGRRG